MIVNKPLFRKKHLTGRQLLNELKEQLDTLNSADYKKVITDGLDKQCVGLEVDIHNIYSDLYATSNGNIIVQVQNITLSPDVTKTVITMNADDTNIKSDALDIDFNDCVYDGTTIQALIDELEELSDKELDLEVMLQVYDEAHSRSLNAFATETVLYCLDDETIAHGGNLQNTPYGYCRVLIFADKDVVGGEYL